MDERSLESGLARALERGEFLIHYQPQVDALTGRVEAVEALLRWSRPGHGLVSPALFIPVAESTGLIVDIGDWVLREACRQSRRWLDAGLPAVRVAVNLSARQFSDADLAGRVASALDAAGLEPHDLELEITESMMAQDPEAASRILRVLRSSGVRLMIDDFGTGYSSLGSLKRFPVDGLKIDRAFVAHLPNDRHDRVITRAVIGMAEELGLDIVAEGVETPAQCAFLTEQRCRLLQGYLTGKPQSPDALAERLGELRPSSASTRS